MSLIAITTCLAFCMVSSSYLGGGLLVHGATPNTYNVGNFGATGTAQTDDSQAFLKAWSALCGDIGVGGTPILIIPRGKFLLLPLTFQGPCKSPMIHVQKFWTDSWRAYSPKLYQGMEGTDSWLILDNIGGLIVDGQGSIDGQGAIWWPKVPESDRPTALRFHNCNNFQVHGVKSRNSPRNHISINDCNGVTISDVSLIAPKYSPNTDGIDISSSRINIFNSNIGAGEDCVAINGGSSNINITNVVCGPRHGISVGSLGKNGKMETVEDVHVRNCSFIGTQNGARIKTWAGGSGYVRRISFEDITLEATERPIIIDQSYCNGKHNCSNPKKSAVQITDITYSGFQGTSATKEAIALKCSDIMGCTNIKMDHVNITSSMLGVTIFASCENVVGKSSFTIPSVACLSSL